MKEKIQTKKIRINGIKTTVIIPPKTKIKDVPNEVRSKQNHPKGLVLTL